jgi:aryl-alcohol dehydrogenase-like predicted oxidoreductase
VRVVDDIGTAALGRTGRSISRVGLGTWAFGGPWHAGLGKADDAESIATIRRAVELGIDWIDTAPAYGLGRSEQVLARALAPLPEDERPLVFTKCGVVWDSRGRLAQILRPDSVRRECDASLRRLEVERIDLLQIHWPSEDGTSVEESWQTLSELVVAGKVRWIGVSNYDVAMLERCERIRHVDTLQPPFNLIRREAAVDLLPWCSERRTGVLIYSPMEVGLLTGRFTREAIDALPLDDYRREHESFREPALSANLALVERIGAIAAWLGCSRSELAVAWTLAWPGVTAAIVGARHPWQLDSWIRAGAIDLTPGDLHEIARAIDEAQAGKGPSLSVRGGCRRLP